MELATPAGLFILIPPEILCKLLLLLNAKDLAYQENVSKFIRNFIDNRELWKKKAVKLMECVVGEVERRLEELEGRKEGRICDFR